MACTLSLSSVGLLSCTGDELVIEAMGNSIRKYKWMIIVLTEGDMCIAFAYQPCVLIARIPPTERGVAKMLTKLDVIENTLEELRDGQLGAPSLPQPSGRICSVKEFDEVEQLLGRSPSARI